MSVNIYHSLNYGKYYIISFKNIFYKYFVYLYSFIALMYICICNA